MIGRHLVCDECNDHCHDAHFDKIGRPKLDGSVDYKEIISTGDDSYTDIVGCGWVSRHYVSPEDSLSIVSEHYCSDCR